MMCIQAMMSHLGEQKSRLLDPDSQISPRSEGKTKNPCKEMTATDSEAFEYQSQPLRSSGKFPRNGGDHMQIQPQVVSKEHI